MTIKLDEYSKNLQRFVDQYNKEVPVASSLEQYAFTFHSSFVVMAQNSGVPFVLIEWKNNERIVPLGRYETRTEAFAELAKCFASQF
jgi:hypothetical protein